MASDHKHIEKRSIEGENYYSLSDLAKRKSKQKPNEVLRNWINLPDTIEFIEIWEKANNPNFKADNFIRFKMNHYNRKRLGSLFEFVRRMRTKCILSINENSTGLYAQVDIAIAFICWMSPSMRLAYIQKSRNQIKKGASLDESELFDMLLVQ